MRIDFVLATLTPSGGGRVIFKLADEWINRGHEVNLFVSRSTNKLPVVHQTKANVQFVNSSHRIPGSVGNLVSFLAQLSQLPQSDALIATYYPTAYVLYLARLFKKHSGVMVYFIQGNETLFCQGIFRPIKRLIASTSYRLPLNMITNSQWTADEIHRIGSRHPAVVGLGIDLDIFCPPVEGPGSQTQRGVVMTIGRHQEIKGYPDFIEAMRIIKREFPGLRLLVVSQEEMQIPPDLEGEIVKPRSDRELVACYQRAQVYVSSSWSEGFGLPGLEAMACGTPLVTTDSGGVREYTRQGENCLLCPAQQPLALAQATLTLLQDSTLRTRLIQAGLQTVRDFSWLNVADRFIHLIQQCEGKL